MLQTNKSSMARSLAIGFGGSFIILTLVSGFSLYWLLAHQLQTERNFILHDRLSAVSTLLKSPAHGYEELKNRIEKEWPIRSGENIFVQVIDGDDKIIMQSPGPTPEKIKSLTSAYEEVEDSTDNSIGLKNPVRVRIQVSGEQSQGFLTQLRQMMLGVFVLNIILSLFVGRQVVERELSRLKKIVLQISQIDAAKLHERIDQKELPKELDLLAEAFNRTLDRLSDSFSRISRFSSDIAHELRTPASNIMGSIEVALSRPRTEEEYCDLLESNLEECGRITRITDSLLFLARAENLRTPLLLTKIDVNSEIRGMIDFYEPLAAEKEIEIDFQPLVSDISLMAESTLFQRVLSNLISNAICFTPKKGKIEIQSIPNGDHVRISFIDSGTGISEVDLPHVFERFYRVDPSRNINSGGSGLGLAIVKSIVDLHSGSIKVTSSLGAGSRFDVFLPIGKA